LVKRLPDPQIPQGSIAAGHNQKRLIYLMLKFPIPETFFALICFKNQGQIYFYPCKNHFEPAGNTVCGK
jgi:hypothetical protein